MMLSLIRTGFVIATALLAPAAIASERAVELSATEVVQLRQSAMAALGGANAVLFSAAKGDAKVPPAVLRSAARTLVRASGPMAALFADGSDPAHAESRSKPEIWRDGAGFAAAIGAYRDAASKLATWSESADIATLYPVMQNLNQTCAACHALYRQAD